MKFKMTDEEFCDWYFETLREKADKLRPYYDIDKVKAYGVYVWSKEDENGDQENVFDICDDEIIFWTDDHTIIEEAKPIVDDIQHFLWKYYDILKENTTMIILKKGIC